MFCTGSAPTPYNLFAMMLAIFPFYFVTMEQHYTGEMIFTEINGVDEGSILICGLCFVTAYLGNTFWKQDVSYPGLPYGILDEPKPLHYILLAFVISTIYPYALSPFLSIWKGRHNEHFKRTWSLYYFLI